jgi:hypothetical protein
VPSSTGRFSDDDRSGGRGHTNQEMVRNVRGVLTYASVGMPYEGRTGAF